MISDNEIRGKGSCGSGNQAQKGVRIAGDLEVQGATGGSFPSSTERISKV